MIRYKVKNRDRKRNAAIKWLLWFLFLGLVENGFTQTSCTTFKLNGFINADSGIMVMLPTNDDSFYPHVFSDHVAQVHKGRFVFSDSIQYPYAFLLALKVGPQLVCMSDVIFIDPCEQTIYCNKDSLREVPKLVNNSMKELHNYNLSLRRSEVKDGNENLLNYVIKNP